MTLSSDGAAKKRRKRAPLPLGVACNLVLEHIPGLSREGVEARLIYNDTTIHFDCPCGASALSGPGKTIALSRRAVFRKHIKSKHHQSCKLIVHYLPCCMHTVCYLLCCPNPLLAMLVPLASSSFAACMAGFVNI